MANQDKRAGSDPNPQEHSGDEAGQRQGDRRKRQIDDNQDDMGRDVNNPDKVSNDINKGL